MDCDKSLLQLLLFYLFNNQSLLKEGRLTTFNLFAVLLNKYLTGESSFCILFLSSLNFLAFRIHFEQSSRKVFKILYGSGDFITTMCTFKYRKPPLTQVVFTLQYQVMESFCFIV